MYSISKGYEHRISPLVIGSIHNIEILTVRQNMTKGDNCSLTIEELGKRVGMSLSDMNTEFDMIMAELDKEIALGEPTSLVPLLEKVSESVAMKIKPYYVLTNMVNELWDDILKNRSHEAIYDFCFGDNAVENLKEL